MNPKIRAVCAALCLLWVCLGTARAASWALGHPGNPVTLALAIVAGVAGLVGLTAFALQWRANRRTS